MRRPGFILVTVALVAALLLAAVTAVLSAANSESRIAASQFASVQAYNLAEGAIQHAVWRLKNDPVWSAAFTSDPSWSATLSRSNVFTTGDGYQLSVQNEATARGTIIATSTWPLPNGSTAQRVVKVKVFKALGTAPTDGLAAFSGTDFTARFVAVVNVALGGLQVNRDITVTFWSNVQTQATSSAVRNININWGSTLSAPALRSSNYPPAPAPVDLPQVDFDSAEATSYRSRAQAAGQVYSQTAFANLLSSQALTPAGLTLNGITYVTGNVDIKKAHHVTINGALVADGHIKIGDTYLPGYSSRYTELRVNHLSGEPSGLLSKNQINVGLYTTIFEVAGAIYANDRFTCFQVAQSANINGGILARDMDVNGIFAPLTITLDQDVLNEALGIQQFSPIISVEHWEEEY